MRRREFISIVAGSMGWPVGSSAQQAARIPIIGFMGAGTQLGWSEWRTAFVQRMHELGWIEGQTVAIEYRWAEGSTDRYAEIAAEFVRLKVDAIVTVGGEAAKQATSSIPIVAALMADPLGQGLVSNLARPGANVTGLSIQSSDLAGKRLELLREAVHELRRVAVMAYVGFLGTELELAEVQGAAKKLGVEIVTVPVKTADEISPAFEGIHNRADALYVPSNPLANANRVQINMLALRERLPTMHGFRIYVEAGGLMSYGPNTSDLFRRAAVYVDKILRGANPANLPVEQPTKFDLIINLKTAVALGLEISPTILARADEVIE
jgi:putative ABC transport system substrate-binding protein